MNQVKGSYKHTNFDKYHFYLEADKGFNYTTWKAPIKWKGFIDGRHVEFIQINDAAYDIECFDWTGFPSELESSKYYIVKAIDDAMRIMD